MSAEYEDEAHEQNSEELKTPPAFFPYLGEKEEQEKKIESTLVEVVIEGVFATESNGTIHRFVLLTDGHRKLSILIGPFESQAISMSIEGIHADRPMSHDLMKNILDRFSGQLTKVVIDDFWSTTYYAKIFIEANGEEFPIDSRPSDALALAIRCSAPIYVTEQIMSYENEF